jgi:regulator of sirC expression with transglutaminase-like and TPR domain
LKLDEYNDPTGALEAFNLDIKINPNEHDAYYYRAQAKEQLGDSTGAILDLNRALEISPDFQDAKILKEKIISRLN